MKSTPILTIALLLAATCSLSAQFYYGFYDVDFEDTTSLKLVEIDTTNNPNNIWQIGAPKKSIFNSALSEPNVIVTDTTNPYPISDTSKFMVHHVSDDLGGFQWPHTVILSGMYQVNSDTLTDFGMIEFSPDNGHTWINLLTDTFYLNQHAYEWYSDKPVLTGNSAEWKPFTAWVAGFGPIFDIQPGDTVRYRFTFISDSIQTNKDGLMFDNLHFEDWAEGIGRVANQFESGVTPNPSTSFVIIEFENPNHANHSLSIFDQWGKSILNIDGINQNWIRADLHGFKSGIYYYLLTNLENGQISTGKVIKINNR